MRIPTIRQVESALTRYSLRYALHALGGVFVAFGIFFRDRLVGLLVQAPSNGLATAVVWLTIAVVVIATVGTFYILKFKKLEKAILKLDPDFYNQQEYDDAFEKAAKDPHL